MLEVGIVFYIIRDVKKAAQENGGPHVDAVVMNIGEVSTVVPEYLTDCWRWAADKEDVLRRAELRCEIIPAITHCNACGNEYSTVKHGKKCPQCGSEDTFLVQGNEVEIKHIEIKNQ